MTIIRRMQAACSAASSEAPALTLLGKETERVAYPQLWAEAERFARRLAAIEGVTPGRVVVVMLPHGRHVYAALLGALMLGCRPAMFSVPSFKHPVAVWLETVAELVEVAAPAAIVVDDRLADQLHGRLAEAGLTTATVSPGGPALEVPFEVFDADPDDVAILQFSSGTTGLKKGVQLTHRQVLSQLDRYAAAIGLSATSDVICSWLPLYHDMGFIACCLLPLVTGTPLVAMSPFQWVRRPRLLLEAITDYGGTLAWTPNFSLLFMADTVGAGDLEGLDLSSMRGLVNCSEPLTAEAMQAFDARFGPAGWSPSAHAGSYALAENTFAVTSAGTGQPMSTVRRGDRIWVSSGRPLPETEIRIIDGEIAIGGPSLFAGYHGEAAQAAEFKGGLFVTGDLGFMHDGELYVTGRKKDLLILRGENHFAGDLEIVVGAAQGVTPGRCAALGRFDDATGTEVLVVVAESAVTSVNHRRAVGAGIARALIAANGLAAADIVLAPPGWLLKSTSGKMKRQANAERVAVWLSRTSNSHANDPADHQTDDQTDDQALWRWDGRSSADRARDDGAGAERPTRPLDAIDEHVAKLVAGELQTARHPVPDTVREILDLDLLFSGALDSLAFAGLLVLVEIGTDVTLADDDISFSDHLATGAGIADLVRRRRAAPPGDSSMRDNDHDAKCRLFRQSSRDFDVVVLGTSRSTTLRMDEATARGLTAFNMSVSAASIEDYAALLRFVVDTAKRPPLWLFCEWHVDLLPFQFHVISQLLSSKDLARYLPNILPSDGPLMRASVAKQGGGQVFRRRNDVLDWLRLPEPDPGRAFIFEAGTGDKRYVADDETSNAINADRALELPDETRVAKRHLAMKSVGALQFGGERHQALAKFLGHVAALAPRCRLVLFEPPEHASLGPFMRAEVEGYEQRRVQVLTWVKGAARPKRLFYDLRDPETFGGSRADFRDSWHVGGFNGRRQMAWLLDNAAADWPVVGS